MSGRFAPSGFLERSLLRSRRRHSHVRPASKPNNFHEWHADLRPDWRHAAEAQLHLFSDDLAKRQHFPLVLSGKVASPPMIDVRFQTHLKGSDDPDILTSL